MVNFFLFAVLLLLSPTTKSESPSAVAKEAEALVASPLLLDQPAKTTETAADIIEAFEPQNSSLYLASTELDSYIKAAESDNLQFLKIIEAKTESLQKLRTDLNELLTQEATQKIQLRELLSKVTLNWEMTVDFISDLFKNVDISISAELPSLLAPPETQQAGADQTYTAYLEKYEQARRTRTVLAQKRTDMVSDLRAQTFQLLSESGEFRSRLFEACDRSDFCDGHRDLNSRNIADVMRELKIIPVKYQAGFVAKVLEFKAKLRTGFDGWIDLFQQFVALFLILFIPFALLKVLRWINLRLEVTRRAILSRSMMDFEKRTTVAVWISRLNPFVPASGMILGIWLARSMIETTDLKELSTALFYLELYFIYRIFQLLVHIGLEILFSSGSVVEMNDQRSQVDNSAKRISRLFFGEYALLYLIENTVREALVYGIFSTAIFLFNIVFIFWEAWRWRNQILGAARARFPKYETYLAQIKSKSLILFLINPLLLLVVAGHDFFFFIYSHLIRIDFVKRIHSEIFKRRIESATEETLRRKPSDAYLKYFDYDLPATDDIFIKSKKSPIDEVVGSINLWLQNQTSNDLLILVGHRGLGKTTVLKAAKDSIKATLKIHKFDSKTLDLRSFYQGLSKILNAPVQNLHDILEVDRTLENKTVVFVDDVQELFLTQFGGFTCYKEFVDVLNLRTSNIFWCLTYNAHSWNYLKGAFGSEHLYGKILPLLPWKDHEIQKLILSRHDKTGYSRQFDKSVKAYSAGGDTLGHQAETQLFRLIWGQSRGNPRLALMYWVSAVAESNSNQILVGVPSFISSSVVASISDDSLFLLAAVVKHGSLTEVELHAVTRIKASVIRKCMMEAVSKDLLWIDSSGRYRVNSRAQYVLDYYLIGKNFLYE